MHVILKNQATNQTEGVLCIERLSKTCFILYADIDRLDELVAIAKSQKVPDVLLVVPNEVATRLMECNWKVKENMVVLTK